MLGRYVWWELVRNPRRALASLIGVLLGVGLFSGVLFFVDGSSATMTKRALAPLALDMQRVLTSPLGGGVRLEQHVSAPASLRAGDRAEVVLTVTNSGAVPANEVVVNDEPPPRLAYVPGSTRVNGRRFQDVAGQSPLAQGAARSGLNIGTVRAGATVRLTYLVRAQQAVRDPGTLPVQGTVSSREDVAPTPANAPPPLTQAQLAERIARIPGVAAADRLSFVDLPAGSLRGRGAAVDRPIRVFAFDRRYQEHYPSIRMTAGSLRPGVAVLSAEAARAVAAAPGGRVDVRLPGRRAPLSLPVGGVADLSRAKPLFYSRKSRKLEDFLYVPHSVVVSPGTFDRAILPAFRAAAAARGSVLKSFPALEVDVLVDRSRLSADPATALGQSRSVADRIGRIAPSQNYLIDNISNTLAVARADAAVGKRMFFFLGLPGIVLAAFLAAYAGGILAGTQRREQANLRVRGADRGQLLRILVYRTLALAGAGALLGVAAGFVSVLAILGRETLFDAGAADLLTSACIGVGAGMLTTALALYVPGHRALRREVMQERREVALTPVPAWRRLRLDFVLLGVAALVQAGALAAGAFDTRTTAVSAGESVSLPTHLLIAPLVAWIGGTLLLVRLTLPAATRLLAPKQASFGPVLRGILGRSLKRRAWALATGIIGVALVTSLGVGIALFSATYDAAKAADSRFVVGSDLRLTPSASSVRPASTRDVARLDVAGVDAATPVVSKPENSVLIGPYDQDHQDLAAIDPAVFRDVAPLSDTFFTGTSAAGAMSALDANPRGLLVGADAADQLSIDEGDRVRVLLARGTKRQTLESFRVIGLFGRFPGFPQGVDLVANLGRYERATGTSRADFFLVRAADGGHAGLTGAVAAARAGLGRELAVNVESTETALDKDQSSLTALNLNGLVDLDWVYTLLMTVAAIGIFVFGLMLQRRREYVTLRAQGMRTGEVRALVLTEVGVVVLSGLAIGVAVGTGMAYLLVHVLQPLFVLDPGLRFATGEVALLALLATAATVASALTASALLRRLRPTELLRET